MSGPARLTLAAIVLLTALAGCGVDGAPVAPNGTKPKMADVNVSGSFQVGVAGGNR